MTKAYDCSKVSGDQSSTKVSGDQSSAKVSGDQNNAKISGDHNSPKVSGDHNSAPPHVFQDGLWWTGHGSVWVGAMV